MINKQRTLLGGMIWLICLILLGVPAMADSTSGTTITGTIPPPPAITAISPSSGLTGGGTPVTLSGTGFVSGAAVTIGGNAATGVTFGSATSITATVPSGAAGARDVVVTNPDNWYGTLTGGFTYYVPASGGGMEYIPPTPAPTPTGNTAAIPGLNPGDTSIPLPTAPDTAMNLKVNMQGDITTGAVNTQTGKLQNSLNSASRSGTLSLTVFDGTISRKADGSRLAVITVDPATDVTPLPKETALVGQVMDFGPEGAIFVPPLVIHLYYADSDIAKGSSADDLYIGLWDGTQWTPQPTYLDKTAKTLTASVGHFSDYALLMGLHSSVIPTPAIIAAVTPSAIVPTITPAPALNPIPAAAPFNWRLIAGILGGLIIVLLLYLWLVVNRRKRLVFIGTSESRGAGVASKMTVQVLNAHKRPYAVAENTTLKLSSTSGSGRFDLNATGAFDGSVSTVIIPEDASSVSFYYRDTWIVAVEIKVREFPGQGWKRGTYKFTNLVLSNKAFLPQDIVNRH